ncbi:MAG: haloacid dehalogenase-like hydrolase [Gammaproteobacteria bacterium]|nr:haloacid dehalogenase-like hydrolase [Gammaproteobacteria bacterium]MCP5137095.1 haloacid dehalogenase-like hydrolase [Gammaproteobacteria bacterium]
MPAAIFDFDSALISGPPIPAMFYDFMKRRRMVRARHVWQRRWFFLRYLIRYRSDVTRYNLAWLGGMRRADVDVFAEAFVKRKLIDMIRPEMWDRLDRHRMAGDTLILVGESPSFMLELMARELDISLQRGTICAYLGNLYLSAPPTRFLRGDEKARAISDLLSEQRIDPDETVAYLRDAADLPLMNAIGKPVLVSPNRAMHKLAKARGWDLIENY